MLNDKKFCYFVLPTVTDKDGNLKVLCVREGETGYYETDREWGKDIEIAEECARKKNEALGLSEKDVMKLIGQSMRSK